MFAADLSRESLLSLAQAARLFPPARLGRSVCASTVWRWCRKGVRVEGGLVRLEAVRLSGRWLTSREAISRFVARQTPVGSAETLAPRTSGQRRRAAERAGDALEKMGL